MGGRGFEGRCLRAIAALGLAMLAGACASLPGTAPRGTLEKIATTREIVIGHRDAAVPFSFMGSEGKPAGYSVDLCARVAEGLARRIGIDRVSIRWVQVGPPDARVSAVADRQVDIECGVTTVTLTRQRSVDFSSPIFVDGAGLLVLSGSPLATGGSIASTRIGVIPGTTTESVVRSTLARARIQATVVPLRDHADGVRAVNAKEVDVYAADRTVLLGLALASRNRDNLSVSDEQLSFEPFALALPRNDADFRLAVNREIARIFSSDDILEVYRRWLGPFGEPGVMTLATYRLGALPE